ncbi:putative tyrosine-protein phosphatase auxilin isoform X2 [Cucurbita pepo subsp. pepo]|uniref:putative tyrosine-protein phosphatase auxilin isoform X2 n=1 Tax=Cucurbita pepo subsp. pepo TaxID=3664 RepID=UPI000C9D8192|nr:putative tyrosine-protein phosphatase auxilin isoform X2 [Cucurbita pepo subsp. pepo]
MDESWRMRMGVPDLPRRRSAEGPSIRSFSKGAGPKNHEDFSDVFGGPPRSVLSRQFSGEVRNKQFDFFYEEMFRPPECFTSAKNAGRNLPVFRIPAGGEGFYNDIFGSDQERRSRDRSRQNSKGKSKSNSSSVLSSEEASPFRHVIGDDVVLSSFAAKLRPIHIPTKWSSSKMKPEEHQKKQGMSFFSFNRSASMENQYVDNEVKEPFRSSYCGFPQPMSSPETISLEPTSYRSMKVSMDDLEPNSPSSLMSSLCQESEAKPDVQVNVLSEEEDEVMSSYVIEIGSDNREGTNEAVALDEVIAWAKEKFNTQTSETDLSTRLNDSEQFVETEGRSASCEFSGEQLGVHDITRSSEMEMEDIDEDIKLWSSGKETNIRLLLSTLHHILWPRSGWHVTPLTSLMEGSQVKKAYQKARLCLHPDKLQQRGATNMQKYVAEKAFTVLQEAWTAFISQDAFF